MREARDERASLKEARHAPPSGRQADAPADREEGAACGASARSDASLRIAYFGPDATHATVRKRIHAYQHAGAEVHGYTFRRAKINRDFRPDWPNTPLGETRDRYYLARMRALLGAARKLAWQDAPRLRGFDVFHARNFDMLAIAVAVKRLTKSRARIVYEVPDIQRFFFRDDAFGRLMRGAERMLLRRTDLIVCSSPAYMDYFRDVQGYGGPHFVWLNRVLASELPSQQVDSCPRGPAPGPPWIIGWYGTLRCVRSIQLLAGVARALPDRVVIQTRGLPTETGVEGFKAIVGELENFRYGGEYQSPGDLEEIYSQVHFSWCLDFHDAEGNSELLLPNRLYQGALYGAVLIGHERHETGRYIAREEIGFTIGDPVLQQAIALFAKLEPDSYLSMRQTVLQKRRRFFDDGSDTQALLRLLEGLAT